MKADFPALWAESPSTLRREPTNAEMAGGFPCGDLDINLWNELVYRLAQVYREVAQAVSQNGQAPNAAILNQLSQSIRRPLFAVDTGTPNHLVLPIPNWDGREGCLIAVRVGAGNTNTGATDVAIGGTAAVALTYADGSPLKAGELVAGRNIVILTTPTGGGILASPPIKLSAQDVALWHSGTAGGTASAVAVSDLNPSISAYADKLPILLSFPNGVADGATVQIGSLAVIPIQRNDGSPIKAGDIPIGSAALFNLFGTGALRLTGFGRGEVPVIPTTNPSLYVDLTGSDSNDGTLNRPFQTIGAALTYGTSRFSLSGGTLAIILKSPGTYAAPGPLRASSGTILIQGDAANQDAYVISGAGQAGGGGGVVIAQSGSYSLVGLRILNTGVANHTLSAGSGAFFACQNVTLDATSNPPFFHAQAASAGNIFFGTGCKANGSAAGLAAGVAGGNVRFGANFVVTGSPAWSQAAAYASSGYVTVDPGITVTGSATGSRYSAVYYGVIQTYGQGPNVFPGNAAGSVSNGLYQ